MIVAAVYDRRSLQMANSDTHRVPLQKFKTPEVSDDFRGSNLFVNSVTGE